MLEYTLRYFAVFLSTLTEPSDLLVTEALIGIPARISDQAPPGQRILLVIEWFA